MEWYPIRSSKDILSSVFSKETVETKTNIFAEDITIAANGLGLKNEKIFSKQENTMPQNTYEYAWKDLIFNIWELAWWEDAYDTKIVSISKKTALWLSDEESQIIDQDHQKEIDDTISQIDKKMIYIKFVNKIGKWLTTFTNRHFKNNTRFWCKQYWKKYKLTKNLIQHI
jgi:hypothetical protein